jgi:hypothetical protein
VISLLTIVSSLAKPRDGFPYPRRSRYSNTLTPVAEIPLVGTGGEPVDFARTIVSHGVAELPPNRVDLAGHVLETTLPVRRGARTVRLTEDNGTLRIEGSDDPKLTRTVAHMFRLDEDLSAFYELVREDELAWCALGAGRMLRAPTVFEDVVKTICTLVRTANRGITTGRQAQKVPPDGSRCPSPPRVRRGGLRMPTEFQIPLRGPSGEPVDLVRTFMSHGVADLLPGRVDEPARTYTKTLALPSAHPRTIRISPGRPGFARVEVEGRKLGQQAARGLTAAVRQILNLDEDLSEFERLQSSRPQ